MTPSVPLAESLCPICGNSQTFVEYPAVDKGLGAYDLWRCKKCQASYVGSKPDSALMQRWYADYHDVKKKDHGGVYFFDAGKIRQRLRVFFFNYPERSGSFKEKLLLDIGCGEGAMLLGFKPHFKSIEGIERSEESAALCRTLGLSVACGELKDGVFPEKRFDVVTMFDLIEHLEKPEEALRATAKILKDKGWLCITTPNALSLKYAIVKDRWVFCTPPDHMRLFSARALDILLEKCGFEMVRVRPSSRLDIFPFFGVLDTFRYLLGLNKKVLRSGSQKPAETSALPSTLDGSMAKILIKLLLRQFIELFEILISIFVNGSGRSCHLYVFARKK